MVLLEDALGRVLPREVPGSIDSPPFDKSAMDGFAHSSPLPAPEGPWRVMGVVAAGGRAAASVLGPGECLRIMTGAMIPQGADAVVPFEHAEGLDAPARVRVAAPVPAPWTRPSSASPSSRPKAR